MKTIDNPLISVVIPSYNRADFIIEAVESVLSQTYQNLEVHLVDDGSEDNTAELIKQFDADPRFNYYYQENQGQAVARNLGIEKSTGDFICFIDSDNKWVLNKLELSIAALKANPEADILYGDIIEIDEQGAEITRKNMQRHSGRITPWMLKDNCVSMNTTMAKRECFTELGSFTTEGRRAEDYDLWLRFSSAYSFLYLPEFLAYYRVMDDQISSDKERRFIRNQEIIEKFIVEYPNASTKQEQNDGWFIFWARRARYYSEVKKRFLAVKSTIKAISFRPLTFKSSRLVARIAINLITK